VIDVSPSVLVYNSSNEILIRMSGISNEFFKIHWSTGVQEVVQGKLIPFGTSFIFSSIVTVSIMQTS